MTHFQSARSGARPQPTSHGFRRLFHPRVPRLPPSLTTARSTQVPNPEERAPTFTGGSTASGPWATLHTGHDDRLHDPFELRCCLRGGRRCWARAPEADRLNGTGLRNRGRPACRAARSRGHAPGCSGRRWRHSAGSDGRRGLVSLPTATVPVASPPPAPPFRQFRDQVRRAQRKPIRLDRMRSHSHRPSRKKYG